VAILVTDGTTSNSLSTLAEAAAAQRTGIKILAIGASLSVNITELQLISSSPRIFYHQWWTVNNFASLSTTQPIVIREVCRMEYGELCVYTLLRA